MRQVSGVIQKVTSIRAAKADRANGSAMSLAAVGDTAGA
jgi:hypothetical protein